MKTLAAALLALSLLPPTVAAQQVPATPPPATPPAPAGSVLFSTDKGEPSQAPKLLNPSVPEVTTAERTALTFTAYDLDLHLVPAEARITVRAKLTLRNSSSTPLTHLPLQLSSSLTWESITVAGSPVTFAQHLIDTDADHTGKANEAVVTLPHPLAPGANLTLTAFYAGTIPPDASRFERIGAPTDRANEADWDAISPQSTALRGYGNVLWYPVAAEPVFLGEGAKLFESVGENRLRQADAQMHLRLIVEFVGDPPDAAFFCGRREAFTVSRESSGLPAAESPGVATADFAAQRLSFRSPSLFITPYAATITDDTLIAAVTEHHDAVPSYAAAAALVRPLLTDWLGPQPLTQLTILDHPGQPFEDGALLVTPLRAVPPSSLASALIHSLAHAWFRSSHVWLDEGVPQLLSLLWTEQTESRDAALQVMQAGTNALALAEPETSGPQSLIAASNDIYYRTKAASVLWMLRYIVGDDALRQTLPAYRTAANEKDPEAFERALEKTSGKDLRWFFDDWVYRDRGLPDLAIANVTPRQLPAQGTKEPGWLVAVDVRNDGGAVAEVPVTVRSGSLTASARLRIPARSSASTRILFGGTPEEVQVNDGTVPELRASVHTLQIKSPTP